jgi:hypothetical protein
VSSSYPSGAGNQMLLTCRGTKRYPGCKALFLAATHKPKFCPTCAGLDRPSSYVFVERRRALEAKAEQEGKP